MASVHKRPSDIKRGPSGKWTMAWINEDGKLQRKAGSTDHAASLRLANELEQKARRVREGVAERGEDKRAKAAKQSIVIHVDEYKSIVLAKKRGEKHAAHVHGVIKRLLSLAKITSVTKLSTDTIQLAIGTLRETKSARTCNHALRCVRAFIKWLYAGEKIKDVPRGLELIPPFNEEVDKRRIRRVLTKADLAKLLAAAESGVDVHVYGATKSKHHKIPITGPQRALLYRLAMATGFRANELRTLTADRFILDGPEPSVIVDAGYAKNRKAATQPIRSDLAEVFRPLLAAAPGQPVLPVPHKTAKLLRHDLAAAGIPHTDERGRVFDFHALRATYITHLHQDGVDPKTIQKLARHSTITLTMDRYLKVEDEEVRVKLEATKSKQDKGNA